MAVVSLEANTFTLQIPQGDLVFFKTLVQKMGWTVKQNNAVPAETIAAIKEARSGQDGGIVRTDSLESFIASMD